MAALLEISPGTGVASGAAANPRVRAYPVHCAENWVRTSLHAGESEAACVARHSMMRPPPGSTPGQSARTSPPQADRNTNSTSRGRIGRSTSAASGAAAGAALGAVLAVLGAVFGLAA